MRAEALQANTVQPYPAATKWTFSATNGYTFTEELVLYAEPSISWITDDYLPEEISAQALWEIWVDKQANYFHEQWPHLYRFGEVHIAWYVTRPQFTGIFESAPHTLDVEKQPTRRHQGARGQDFLTHYTDPVHAETGEELNWMRLPVMDRGWNETAAQKGGFIQEATGWKPSPLQPTMDVVQIGRAAGLYVPPLPD
ncbi:hypothetical protein [Streptomyces lydicus]|uniref:hypothetical protein n=1 Tax=Streptomyces lydicus TaxID=47763 RepID=UPI0036EA8EBA